MARGGPLKVAHGRDRHQDGGEMASAWLT